MLFSCGGSMKYNGLNLSDLKNINRSEVLRLLNDQGDLSRKDIAVQLGLTPAAVTQICAGLLSEGLLVEKGEVRGEKRKAGRKKISLGINPHYAVILSINFSPDKVTMTICSMNGTPASKKSAEVSGPVADPDTFVSEVAAQAAEFYEKNAGREHLLGVGVVIPAKVNQKTGMCGPCEGLWERDVDLRRLFNNVFRAPVIFEEHGIAAAEAEVLIGNGRMSDTLLMFYQGKSIASTLTHRQRIYEKDDKLLGDIGQASVTDLEGKKLSLRDLARKTDHEDEDQMKRLLELSTNRLGELIRLFQPDRLIVAGSVFQSESYYTSFRKSILRECPDFSGDLIIKSVVDEKLSYICGYAAVFHQLLL